MKSGNRLRGQTRANNEVQQRASVANRVSYMKMRYLTMCIPYVQQPCKLLLLDTPLYLFESNLYHITAPYICTSTYLYMEHIFVPYMVSLDSRFKYVLHMT